MKMLITIATSIVVYVGLLILMYKISEKYKELKFNKKYGNLRVEITEALMPHLVDLSDEAKANLYELRIRVEDSLISKIATVSIFDDRKALRKDYEDGRLNDALTKDYVLRLFRYEAINELKSQVMIKLNETDMTEVAKITFVDDLYTSPLYSETKLEGLILKYAEIRDASFRKIEKLNQ